MRARAPSTMIGFDTETHLITRGRAAPRLVCLSLYGRGDPPAWVGAEGESDTHLVRVVAGLSWEALFTGPRVIDTFAAALADPEALLVAHNAPFDLAVLAAYGGAHGRPLLSAIFAALDEGRIRDTMTRETLLAIAHDRTKFDPALPPATSGKAAKARFDLAGLVLRYFGQDIAESKKAAIDCDACLGVGVRLFGLDLAAPCPDCRGTGQVGPWRLRYSQLDGRPLTEWPAEAVDYALDDARWACLVHDAQSVPDELPAGTVVGGFGGVTDEDAQLRAFFALHLAALHGVRTDPVAVEALAAEVEGIVEAGDCAAVAAGFVRDADGIAAAAPIAKHGRPGSRSLFAVRALVEAAFNGAPPMTKKGAIKTDRDTLLASGDPALIAYAESGVARKLLTTYVPLLRLGTEHPITSRPVPILRSGRAGWRDPSLQTGPRLGGYRPCFVPRPGFVFVAVDYHLAEVCSLAQVHLWMGLGDTLAERLRRGEDVHLSFGAGMVGCDYDTAVAAYRDHAHPLHADVKKVRQVAKAANFGFPGGLGAAAFVHFAQGYGVELTEGEAYDLRRQWLADVPEMEGYFNFVGRSTGYGPTTVRQFVSGRIRGGVGFCDGCNTLFQGLTADGAKAAAWDVARACYVDEASPLFGSRPWVFIHDEIIAEVPDDERLTPAADELSRLMVEAMRRFVPDVPISASPAAMRRWHKDAEEVRDEAGNLLAWSP